MECGLDQYTKVLDHLGLPLALLGIMIWLAVKLFRWLGPLVEKWVAEYYVLQNKKAQLMEEASKECARIQHENLLAIRALSQILTRVDAHFAQFITKETDQ